MSGGSGRGAARSRVGSGRTVHLLGRGDMPTRTATTTWNGDLQSGSGTVEMTSSKVGSYEVSFPARTADETDGVTSPEELIAAAHSSCFAMQFSNVLAKAEIGRAHV